MNFKHPLRNVVLLVLLAAVCVGTVELLFCRFAAPDLFAQVTAPAVSMAQSAWAWTVRQAKAASDQAKALAAQAKELIASLAPQPEPELLEDAQISGDPAIVEELSAADPTVTEFRTEDGREVLTGGNVLITYYNQKDEIWADQPYGYDHIGGYGCGPTALSMLVSSLTDQDIDPAEMAAWASGAGYCARRSGSYLSIVEGTAKYYGLDCQSLPPDDPEALINALSTGGIAVALMGPGHFTKGGHFILLHGVTLSGGVLAADPNSRENCLTVWDPQLILDELSRSRSNGAPLWLLTLPPTL